MVDFKEFVIGLLILGGNSAATSLDDEALDFMFRWGKYFALQDYSEIIRRPRDY